MDLGAAGQTYPKLNDRLRQGETTRNHRALNCQEIDAGLSRSDFPKWENWVCEHELVQVGARFPPPPGLEISVEVSCYTFCDTFTVATGPVPSLSNAE